MSCSSWCNPVFKRVTILPHIDYATRNHAYILPDDTIWILNEKGDGYIQLSTKAVKYTSSETVIVDDENKKLHVDVNRLGITPKTEIQRMIDDSVVPDTNTTYTIINNNLVGSDGTTVPLGKTNLVVNKDYSIPNYNYYNIEGTLPLWYMYANGVNLQRMSVLTPTDKHNELHTTIKYENGILTEVPKKYTDAPRILGYVHMYDSYVIQSAWHMWGYRFRVRITNFDYGSTTLYILMYKNRVLEATSDVTLRNTIEIPNNNSYVIYSVQIPIGKEVDIKFIPK